MNPSFIPAETLQDAMVRRMRPALEDPPDRCQDEAVEEGVPPPCVDRGWYAAMDDNRLTIQLFLLVGSLCALWACMHYCVPCVFAVMVVSLVFCFEYRLMNIVLWASVLALWFHGWSLGNDGRGFSISWK